MYVEYGGMDDFELGWLTGLIDGEGCFTLRIFVRKTKTAGMRPRFSPQMTITNTDETFITRACGILHELGIGFYRQKRQKGGKNKIQHEVMIYANGLRMLLPKIVNRLGKKREAELMLEACAITKANHHRSCPGQWGGGTIKYSVLERLQAIRTELQGLHGRQSRKLLKINLELYRPMK